MPDTKTTEFNSKDLKAVHLEAIEEHRLSADAVRPNHGWAQDDVRFLQGGDHQWLDADLQSRNQRGAPHFTLSPLNVFVGRVVGDMLLNKPALKAVPVDDDADKDTAETISGLMGNIEHQSKAGMVYKHVGKAQVGHGFGYMEVISEYTGRETFEQDIKIKKIKNSFSVIPDENSEDITLADANKCFIERWMTRKEFKREYPKEEDPISFPQSTSLYPNYFSQWFREKDLLVVKYYRRVKKKIDIVQLSDGRVVSKKELRTDLALQQEVGELTVENERTAEYFEVYKYLLTGDKVIDGPHKIMSDMIPVVRAAGRTLEVGDYTVFRGLIRDAKDAQMMANYWISTIAESLTTAPKAPYMVTAKMIEGYEEVWRNSSKVNYAYLPYKPDPLAPGAVPTRLPPAFLPDAAFLQYQQMGVDTKNTIGLQDASLGIPSNEKSGVAIEARERQGNVQTFEFIDNLNDAITQVGSVILQMIPNVYDTRRVMRLLNPDGTTEEVILNNRIFDQDSFTVLTDNDMSVGKYDVRIETGPSFTTKRQETARMMVDLMRALPPQMAGLIADVMVRSTDIVGADEIAERLKKMLPPGIVEPEEGEEPPPPPQPTPAEQIEAGKLQVEQAKVEVDMAKVQMDGAKLEAELKEGGLTPEEEEDVRAIARDEAIDVVERVGT